jgi:DNA-binding Lrp family transcriptional regulator
MPRRQTKGADVGRSKPLPRYSKLHSEEEPNRNKHKTSGNDLQSNKEKFSDVLLVNHGEIKSSEIAKKLKIPLSTIQRRRARIEKSILKKIYKMDLTLLGYRTAQIFVDVQGGKAKEVGEELLKKYDRNVVNASTRINSSNNLCLEIVYNGSEELHYLLEEIKSIPLVGKVDWSEQVAILGDNISTIIKNTLSDRLRLQTKE